MSLRCTFRTSARSSAKISSRPGAARDTRSTRAGPTMFKSPRYRLQAWHTLILLLVVAGFGSTLYVEASRRRFDEIDGELLAAARVLEGVLRTQLPGLPPPGGPAFRDGPPPKQDRAWRPPPGPGPPGKRLMPPHPPRFEPNALSLPHSLMDQIG